MNRLMWLNAKQRKSITDNKNKPGRKPEHVEALAINAAFELKKAEEKIENASE